MNQISYYINQDALTKNTLLYIINYTGILDSTSVIVTCDIVPFSFHHFETMEIWYDILHTYNIFKVPGLHTE